MFKVDQPVIVVRGKSRGPAIVVLEADTRGQIAVRNEAGEIVITTAENLKPAPEATLTVTQLGEALSQISAIYGGGHNAAIKDLVVALKDRGVDGVPVEYTERIEPDYVA